MKRTIGLALASAMLISAAFAQTTIFDTTGATSYTTTGSSPRFLLADTFTPITSTNGTGWDLLTISSGFFVFANAALPSLANATATYTIFDTTSTSTDPAMSNPVASFQINFGTINQTASNQAFSFGPVDISSLNIHISDGTKGVSVAWSANGSRTDQIAMALADFAPTVGTATNGFYRDANDNGIIEQSDARTFAGQTNTNVILKLTANASPAPEPASMAVLGVGVVALIRKRRSKKA